MSRLQAGILLFLLCAGAALHAQEYVTVSPGKSDGVYTLLKRYGLPTSRAMIARFWELNSDLVRGGEYLRLGFEYKLPVYKLYFDGTSIRSSLGMKDLALARKIEEYNQSLHAAGILAAPYKKSRELWVPADWLSESSAASEPASFAIFGPRYQSVQQKDQSLKGCVVYLDPGHGGRIRAPSACAGATGSMRMNTPTTSPCGWRAACSNTAPASIWWFRMRTMASVTRPS